MSVTEHEAAQVERANASKSTPVVFVHGLWLLPSSWDRGPPLRGERLRGPHSRLAGRPGDGRRGEEEAGGVRREVIGDVADHFEAVIRKLKRKPAVIGHSFGGLLTEILAGRGLAAASVAIAPAPFRGVLPLPLSALRAGSPVLKNPANVNRAVPLTYEQFRYCSRTRSTRTRRMPCTSTARSLRRESRSFRRRARTSIPGRRRRSTPRTRNAARCCSSTAKRTTPSRRRS